MAQLTDRLGLTDGTNRVFDPPAAPSALGSALEFAEGAFEGYMTLRRDMAENKRRAKAAEEKEEQAAIAYEVAGAPQRAMQLTAERNAQSIAGNAAVQGWKEEATHMDDGTKVTDVTMDENGVFSTTTTSLTPAAEREIGNAASRAMSVVAAVEQSKLPPITLEAALNADFRRLREKYPGNVEHILDMYKKAGIDSNLFTELQDAKDEREYNREANQAQRTKEEAFRMTAIEAAKVAYGTDSLNMSNDELHVQGLRIMKSARDLEEAGARADLQTKLAAQGKANKEEVEADLNLSIERIIGNMAFNDSAPYIRMGNELMDSLIRDPNNAQKMEQWQSMGPKVNQLVELSVNRSIEVAMAKGYTGDPEKLRTSLRNRFEPIKQMFAGDYSLANVSMTALKSIQSTLKLDVAESLPFFSALQAAGMKPEAMPGLLKAIDGNPQLQDKLNKEAKGFVDDWGEDRGSTRILNAIKLLRGETTLSYMSPQEASKAIPVLVPTVMDHAKQYNAGRMDSPETVVNGVGEIAVNLRTLGPSTNSNLIYIATKGFADASVRRALIKATTDPKMEDKTGLLATIQASRAGSAHLLNNIRLQASKENAQNANFKILWDEKSGEYKIGRLPFKRTLTGEEAKYARMAGQPTVLEVPNKAPVPRSMENLIRSGNINLNNAIELGRVDPSTPKATDLELRKWYALNEPLPDKGGKEPIDLDKQIDKMFEGFDEAITKGIQGATAGPVNLPAEMRNPAGYRTIAPLITKAASAHGIPEPLAIALVDKESSFNPNAQGPVIDKGTHKGDRAVGLGQVMAKTAAKYGVTDRASLNPEQQLDLAFRILKDNYASSGNWPDAVSMYFTGVPYKKAVAQGRTDGFNTVLQYVRDIVGE